MPPSSYGSAPQPGGRYLLTSDVPGFLADLLHVIAAEPTIELLDALGPTGQPHTLVVASDPESVKALRERFGGQLRVEPDQPLSLFAKRHPSQKHVSTSTGGAMPQPSEQRPTFQPQERPQPQGGAAGVGPARAPGQQPASAGGGPEEQPRSSEPAGPGRAQTRTPGKVLGGKKSQYVIAPRRFDGVQPMGLMPLAFNAVEQALRNSSDVEVVDTIGPRNLVGTLADGMSGAPNVIVARMGDDTAETLKQQSSGQLIVERDQPLALYDPTLAQVTVMTQPGMVVQPFIHGTATPLSVVVLGVDNAPVRDAEVILFGTLLPAMGVTNDQGEATLSLIGDSPATIRGLYVKPRADYWEFYQQQPDIDVDEPNVVLLSPLSDTFREFPRRQVYGWGQRAMRLDQVPPNVRGQGVKVAVIDSGAATTHPDLQTIRNGLDIINKRTTPGTWNQDTVAHGSHCAGVIAGRDSDTGIVGFAPATEIHVCKIFPGGQVSQLIDALEYCIEQQIDIANLSLGSSDVSEALEQQIVRAKRLGVACIVAAGNSGGPVQYPASSPHVLAVAAIGKMGEFPQSSHHAQSVTAVGPDGYFSPKFTCFGPEIGVCAPGVAILSTVPPTNYAAWDGTSMAAPHVSGVGALVLAHHPDFQGPFKARNAARVERLFQILKASAQPINLGDPRRTGFGMPDALVALGLQQPARAGEPQFATQGLFGNLLGQAGGPTGGAIGGLFGNRPLGAQIGGVAGQLGQWLPFGVDPLTAAYLQQAQAQAQAQAQQPQFAPQTMMGLSPFAPLPPGYRPFGQFFGINLGPPPLSFQLMGANPLAEAYRRWANPYAALAGMGSTF